MIVLGPILKGILSFGMMLLSGYFWIILIRVFLSWVNPDPYNPVVRILCSLTDPVLQKAKRLMPFLQIGMMDLTPWVVLVGINILREILQNFYIYIVQLSSSSMGIF
ncbi:YggT family protein [PVC group bacterium]|nr:YggT family protein [PVC group bacterium]